jgi:hypothetical protein
VKVALLDLDMMQDKRRRPFPNLALMKLSAWHKQRGDDVFLNFPLGGMDKAYASCVFSWHKPKELADSILYGGSGFGDYSLVLPDEVEHIMPDYSLYSDVDFSLGYTCRGCIRDCWFCKVRQKEGYIRATASVYEFYNPAFDLIVILDNNTLASPNCKETLGDLIAINKRADFNQGLDIRCLTDENWHYLKQIRVEKYRFAFDNIAYEKAVREGLALMLKDVSSRKLSFYVLVGGKEDDQAIERMKLLQSYGVDVYPMIYKDDTGKEPQVNYSFDETIKFHGARQNIRKFLRLAGRLN